MDADSRVALAEIRGDVKLVLLGQDRLNNDVKDLRERVHVHANRIQIVEATVNPLPAKVEALERDKSERKGAIGAAKAVWGFVGAAVVAVIAAVLRSQGV